jgi:UDP-N-acetyl-D-glucosamine dehydrogenase
MHASALAAAIADRTATVGVIGLGYVGLPLAATIAEAGFPIIGFDIDSEKVKLLNGGTSYIDAVPGRRLGAILNAKRFRASAAFDELPACDVIVICVPTPLKRNRDPDLSYVTNTARVVARHLRTSQLVVLESTTFPGTTSDIVKPILEQSGLKSGGDFFLGYSPEREDPGNAQFHTASIPRIVAGDGVAAQHLIESFYRSVVRTVVPVSSPAVAEAAKITENIFRAVNIALVNELKVIYDAMGIDVWEVIDAAATKPFGYMPFHPGPGLGGHCIPIDPFYLAWKAKEYQVVLSRLESKRISGAGPLHRACRRNQPVDAALCRREARTGARPAALHPARQGANPHPRHRLQKKCRRRSREPRLRADDAARTARREGRVSRPPCLGHPGDAGARRTDRPSVGRTQRGNAAGLRLRALGHRSRGVRLSACGAPCAADYRYQECLCPARHPCRSYCESLEGVRCTAPAAIDRKMPRAKSLQIEAISLQDFSGA